MIPIYQLPKNSRLTDEQILKAIAWKSACNSDLAVADRYYQGKNPNIASSDHRNRIPVPYGRKLIKTVLGFMFKEGNISYRFPDEWESYRQTIGDIMDCNDEKTENVNLGRDQAKFGSAYEILYVDNDDAHVQFSRVPAWQVIPVYSYAIKPDIWAAINCYSQGTDEQNVEVYYEDRIEHFIKGSDGLVRTGVFQHRFGDVPVVEFRNNDEGMGDIESITGLIDAHDEILANGLDEDGKYADALLTLKNVTIDDDKLQDMISMRILELPDDASAEYLTKAGAYEGREVLRKVIEGLIHTMSGIPDLSDKDAMAQQSGEALKYLYATFEVMVAGDKQSGFTNGLMRRLRLINSFLGWLGQAGDHRTDGVTVDWKRNLPNEGTSLVENMVKVDGIISRKTQIEKLAAAGYSAELDEELARLEAEGHPVVALDGGTDAETAYGPA